MRKRLVHVLDLCFLVGLKLNVETFTEKLHQLLTLEVLLVYWSLLGVLIGGS